MLPDPAVRFGAGRAVTEQILTRVVGEAVNGGWHHSRATRHVLAHEKWGRILSVQRTQQNKVLIDK